MFDEPQVRSAFYFGLGAGSVIFGLGFGGRPNTLALLTGIAALAYGNSLTRVVETQSVIGVEDLAPAAARLRARVTPVQRPLVV